MGADMNADMCEPMTPEYVFRIISTSSNSWTRDGLAEFLGVDRRNKLFERALDVLKAQGKITEDWLANDWVRINITKAPEATHLSKKWEDRILDILRMQKRVSRSELETYFGVWPGYQKLADVIYQLESEKKIVVGWDDSLGIVLILPKATETAQDAPEAAKADMGSTEAVEYVTGHEYDYYATANAATESVKALADAYVAANVMLITLRADNEKLRKENEQFRRKYAQTEDFSGKYIALKEKLRGMLDAD